MGRDRKLTQEQQDYILELKQHNPKMTAQDVIEAVTHYLVEKKIKAGSSFTPDEIKGLVTEEEISKSAITKHITDVVNPVLSSRSPLDQPWSLGSLVEHPIPPQSLPAVLRAYYAERRSDQATIAYFQTGEKYGHQMFLTIREALWIARLAGIFNGTTDLDTVTLVHWAKSYALNEQLNEATGKRGKKKPLDTQNNDQGHYLQDRKVLYRTLVTLPNLVNQSWLDTYYHITKGTEYPRNSNPGTRYL